MKSTIQWFEPEDNRRKLSATLKADGTLCFGREMCEKIKDKIKVGFWSEECSLMIQNDSQSGFSVPKNGMVKLTKLASQLINTGLPLPLSFMFTESELSNQWRGYIIPALKKSAHKKEKTPKKNHDYKTVLNAYKWIIDKAVYKFAKSTPIDERRSQASVALVEALNMYTPMRGEFCEFLLNHIKFRLLEHNKQFTCVNKYNSVSFDETFRRYSKSNIEEIEDKADREIFCERHLDLYEKTVYKLLTDGYNVDEITEKLGVTERELTDTCENIGERWKVFNGD
jgi:hypothetical protein